MSRVSYLSTRDFMNLNDACLPLHEAFEEPPYLVGSALTSPDFRDVDVRLILEDDDFDRMFGAGDLRWAMVCRGIAAHLAAVTGLPIDFQIQRQTEANAKFDGPRNPMGMRARPYAGGGDATPWNRRTATAAAHNERTE